MVSTTKNFSEEGGIQTLDSAANTRFLSVLIN